MWYFGRAIQSADNENASITHDLYKEGDPGDRRPFDDWPEDLVAGFSCRSAEIADAYGCSYDDALDIAETEFVHKIMSYTKETVLK